MTQKEAVSFCKNEQEVPAHLVEVDSKEESDAIYDEHNRLGFKERKILFWIGIKDLSKSNWVRESDGKGLCFSNWNNQRSRGKHYCAQTWHRTSGWIERNCDERIHTDNNGKIFTALCELN